MIGDGTEQGSVQSVSFGVVVGIVDVLFVFVDTKIGAVTDEFGALQFWSLDHSLALNSVTTEWKKLFRFGVSEFRLFVVGVVSASHSRDETLSFQFPPHC